MMKYTCLSIAGFDGSGGAGIQADLKTFSATGTYGMTVLTAIPVQNTCGVRSCYDISLVCITEQLEAIFDDITPHAIKIGMLFSVEIIERVSSFLIGHGKNIPIVVDPVMVAKSGDSLLKNDAVEALKDQIIPLASIVTPNLPEAHRMVDGHSKKELAENILNLGCKAVLVKGGHDNSLDVSEDFFFSHHQEKTLISERINSKNTHGTGCTLSAAIASFLAQGDDELTACQKAKDYLLGAIRATQYQSVGHGSGPVNHFYQFWNKDDK